jgi:hypothetical protein
MITLILFAIFLFWSIEYMHSFTANSVPSEDTCNISINDHLQLLFRNGVIPPASVSK